ncbi:MAG: DMT family transporter, partial [Bacillota bacterium]|nr:DMT family transporter [Bacillota bacterium]
DGTGTFFSVILAHFIYSNDRLNFNKVLGCILGFAGVLAINFSTDLLHFSFLIKGEGFVMISAFLLSTGSIYGKRISQTLDSTVITGFQLTIGGIFLLASGFMNHGSIKGLNLSSSLLLIYLALLSAAAFGIWAALLKYNKVGVISMYNFLIPVFGTLLSGLFLQENILKFKNFIALILVCAGIIFANRSSYKPQETTE